MRGRPKLLAFAKPFCMVLDLQIIKARKGFTDEEVVVKIKDNPGL